MMRSRDPCDTTVSAAPPPSAPCSEPHVGQKRSLGESAPPQDWQLLFPCIPTPWSVHHPEVTPRRRAGEAFVRSRLRPKMGRALGCDNRRSCAFFSKTRNFFPHPEAAQGPSNALKPRG